MNLYLIDGNSLMNVAFFGTVGPAWSKGDKQELKKRIRQTKDGHYTNAVYTAMEMLIKLMVPHQDNFMAVMFDVDRETIFRKSFYPDYKGNRGEKDEELESQFPIMKELLGAFGIPCFEVNTFEADDIIGTFAKKFEKEIPVKIITRDKDAFQLISEHTSVWFKDAKAAQWEKEFVASGNTYSKFVDPKFFEFNIEALKYFYDLKPEQIVEWKALEGDNSDNIPGVKGVGEKAAIPLIKHFENIEGIYDFIESHTEIEAKEKMKALGIARPPYNKLVEGKEKAFLSKRLATIVENMEGFEGVQIYDLKIRPNAKIVTEVFNKYELHGLIKK